MMGDHEDNKMPDIVTRFCDGLLSAQQLHMNLLIISLSSVASWFHSQHQGHSGCDPAGLSVLQPRICCGLDMLV